jgi:hypothetical protein
MEPPRTSIPHAAQNGQEASSQTLNFLRWLYGDDAPGWLTIWTLPDKATAWFPLKRLDEAGRYTTDRAPTHDVYFGVGLRGERLQKGRGEARDVIALPGLYVEIDIKHPVHKAQNLPSTIDEARQLITEAIPLPPTMFIDSGHGLHAHWLWRELWLLESEAEREAAATLLLQFQRTIQATAKLHGWHVDGTADLARVLRIPGTLNRKDPKHVLPVTIIEDDIDHRYNPSDVTEHLIAIDETTYHHTTGDAYAGELPPVELHTLKIPTWLKTLIKYAEDVNAAKPYPSRSEALFDAVKGLLKAGIDDQVIMSLLLDSRHAVSEKPLEKGRAWLADEVARARAKLNGYRPTATSALEPDISDADNAHQGSEQHDEPDDAPQQSQEPPAQRWIRNEHRRPISCQHNALVWLAKHGYESRIAMDAFRQVITIDGDGLSDELVIDMVRQMEANTMMNWAEVHVRHAIINVGSRHTFSSVKRWLDSLVWDHKNRLWRFFTDTYGAELTDYSDACAKVMFLSAVARAYQPGCKADVMVVLIGEQGIGKSQGIEKLVPEQAWYTDDLGGDLSDRRAGEGLQGKWLIEFSEFARINRATLEMVKSYLSRRVDHYRPAYGKMAKDFPRQCIFIGTTNNPIPLQDIENRRFMPIRCPNILVDIAPKDRDQLWAEAVARYKQGENWWVTDRALLETVKAHQEDARQHDEYEDLLKTELKLVTKITLAEVAERLGIRPRELDKPTQTRLGLVMKAIGFARKRETAGDRHYYWERVK